MTDRFSIELRRHFVETADEVASADRLAAIERLVEAVPQQSPWLVRLRWLVSPWAPYANAGVRAALLVAAALLLVGGTVAVVSVGGSRGASTPFEGWWSSIDPGDKSAQTLVVGPGPTPAVHFEDAFSINCEVQGDSSTLFLADGLGEVQGGRLVVRNPSGGCVTWQVPRYVVTYVHDSVTDTLLDSERVTWRRAEAPPTP
jgi:hypothetical protein